MNTTAATHTKVPGGVKIRGWTVTTNKGSILKSTEKDEWEHQLALNELPEMVYGNNFVRLTHNETDLNIVFNAFDALSMCEKKADDSIKVSSSKKWQEINNSFGGAIEKSFDWTYSTPYCGSIIKNSQNLTNMKSDIIEETTEQIDIEKLKRPDPILFFDDVFLFEDELADNGTSMLSIKIRVMNDSVFLLQRFFLRVDDVIIKSFDTRIYHEFGQQYLLREFMVKESNYDIIKPYLEKDPTLATDVNFIYSKLPVKSVVTEKIIIHK
ncbi:hypothetical protein CYY_006658 [Polysphondylium violaceum]|uniref:TIP41-like protein n=1 Tax=Polysphondylium violaceum TaxID=133409 RepID=A0A8J4PQN5_9MYCE|nr:hypothetical protein CYY_006658 [Polysphondylium violaceum]